MLRVSIYFLFAIVLQADDLFMELYNFPVPPEVQDELDKAPMYLNLESRKNELQNSISNKKEDWDNDFSNTIAKLVNNFSTNFEFLSLDSYKELYQDFTASLQQENYTEWLDRIYDSFHVENLNIFHSGSPNEIYERDESYYSLLNLINRDKYELLETLETTTKQYESILEKAYREENEFRNSIRTSLETLKSTTQDSGIFFERDKSGNLLKNNSTGEYILNAQGKELNSLLDRVESVLDKKTDFSQIAEELQDFLEKQSELSKSTSTLWSEKVFSFYTNDSNSLIPKMYYNINPQEYESNSFVNGIRSFSANPGILVSEVQNKLLGNSNLLVTQIFHADMVANTTYPELNWNSNPFHPVSRIGGRYSVEGDDFKTYTNHTLLCWAGLCLPFDLHKNEEFISIELQFQVKDLNSEKNKNLWDSFNIQLKNESNLYSNSIIPSLNKWNQGITQIKNNHDTWMNSLPEYKREIENRYRRRLEELSSNSSELIPNKYEDNLVSSIQKESIQLNNYKLELPNINEISNELLNGLVGIRDFSIISTMSDTAMKSKRETMESLREQYSKEKILTDSTPGEILIHFQEDGICGTNQFENNRATCLGFIETHGVHKYSSVSLDSNDNLIFKENIYTGNFIFNGIDSTNFDSYKAEKEEVTYKVISMSNVLITDKDLQLFGREEREDISSIFSKMYENISKLEISDLTGRVSKLQKGISETSNKNLSLANHKIKESVERAAMIQSLAESLVSGTSIKSWVQNTLKSKIAEELGKVLNINSDLILAYYNHKTNLKEKRRLENTYTLGGILPKSIGIPLATLNANLLAEYLFFYPGLALEAGKMIFGESAISDIEKDIRKKISGVRLKDYERVKASLDYNNIYKQSAKQYIFKESIKKSLGISEQEAEKFSSILRHFENQKIQDKIKKERKVNGLVTALQIGTAAVLNFVLPPLGVPYSAYLYTTLASAAAQAAIVSHSGNNLKTGTTFASGLFAGLPYLKELKNLGIGLGLQVGYEPEKRPDTLTQLLNESLGEKSSTGISGNLFLGTQNYNGGLQFKDGELGFNVGTGHNGMFADLSLTANKPSLTLGWGDKFGTALGLVLSSTAPSSLFASFNPEDENKFGLGLTASLDELGNLGLGFDIGKIEALSTTLSSGGEWSPLELSENYQKELVSMAVESEGSNNDSSAPTPIPFALLYGLMGLMGFRRRRDDSQISENTHTVSSDSELTGEEPKNPETLLNHSEMMNHLQSLLGIKTEQRKEGYFEKLKYLFNTLINNFKISIHDTKIEEIVNSASSVIEKSPDYTTALENAIKEIRGKGSVKNEIEKFKGTDDEKASLKNEVLREILESNNPNTLSSFLLDIYFEPIHRELAQKIVDLKYPKLKEMGISDTSLKYLINFQQNSSGKVTTGSIQYQKAAKEMHNNNFIKEEKKPKETETPTEKAVRNYAKGENGSLDPNGVLYYIKAQQQACRVFAMYGSICAILEKSGRNIPSFGEYLSKGLSNELFKPDTNHLDSLGESQYSKIAGLFGIEAKNISVPPSTKHGDNTIKAQIPGTSQYNIALDNQYPIIMVRNAQNSHTYFAELSKDKTTYIVINTQNQPPSGLPVPKNDIYYVTGLKLLE